MTDNPQRNVVQVDGHRIDVYAMNGARTEADTNG